MENNTIIGPIENHRKREKGVLVYPVYSRRSEGLSLGINPKAEAPPVEVYP